ncbi:hypothetical protein ACFWVC_16010 [Streptomyces sp. NPDC058691]|uniref:hypothetical protein n=1 Tax=unclassified Streptomyces TaxID=2593676 RepID=UPI0029B1382D|nr:hypothetical protein [Streptomyces sp. MI02-7b]MDX3074273.1 hypothetical protein [Streptomyces sp. MI02-7b]
MGKNKNRGERTGQRSERGTSATTEEHAKSAGREHIMTAPGAEPHVSQKRQKKFGHN